MAIIFSGVPSVGSKLQILSSDRSLDIALYEVYSGINITTQPNRVKADTSPYYTPTNSDSYIKACVVLADGTRQYSSAIAVIHREKSAYEQAKIAVVGNGLSLTDTLNDNAEQSNVVSDIKRISQSIFIILSTTEAEIPMLYMLGSNIPKHLFREVTDANLDSLRSDIKAVLAQQEPRISVSDITIVYDGDHTLQCQINYTVSNSNIKSSYIYNMYNGD